MNTAEFWVLIAFVIFVAMAWKKASAAIGGALDARAERIRSELDEAQRLREEAQALLANFQRRQRDGLKEAEAVIAHAREEADRLRTQAGSDLEASLKRREAQAMGRIAQAEANALAEVRNLTVDVAMGASRRLLETRVSSSQADALINQSIADLPRNLH